MVRTSPATLDGNTLSFTSLPDRFRKRRNETKRNHNKTTNKARNSVLENTHKKWTQREFAIGNFFPPVQVPIIASKCRTTPPPRTQPQHQSLFSSSPEACRRPFFVLQRRRRHPRNLRSLHWWGREENSGSVGG